MSTNLTLCTERECVMSRRERVMQLIGRGLFEREVAEVLRISHRTVQRYKSQEYRGIIARPNRKS